MKSMKKTISFILALSITASMMSSSPTAAYYDSVPMSVGSFQPTEGSEGDAPEDEGETSENEGQTSENEGETPEDEKETSEDKGEISDDNDDDEVDVIIGEDDVVDENGFVIRNGEIIVGYKGSGGNIVIPDAITEIADMAFRNKIAITKITFGSNVKYIGKMAFAGCTGLTDITIPEKVNIINDSLFYGCTNLTSAVMHEGMTEIGDYAFCGCTGLEIVSIPKSVVKIGNYAFSGSGICAVELSDKLNVLGKGVFEGCEKLLGVNMSLTIERLPDCLFRNCSGLLDIYIPVSIKRIGDYAFEGCERLKKVNFSDSVVEWIGQGSFAGCSSLKNAVLPLSCAVIDDEAFEDCCDLSNITMPSTGTYVGKSAFLGCSSLLYITLPDGITELYEGMFFDCSEINMVNIPATVTKIDDLVFVGADKLHDIYFGGTRAEWDKMKGVMEQLPKNVVIHCRDGIYGGDKVMSIELKGNIKKTYNNGEPFSCAGVKIFAVYGNGNEETVDLTSDMIFGYDANKAGEQNVFIRYGGKELCVRVNVGEAILKDFIVIAPDKKNYFVGDDLDLTGGKIIEYYSNNTDKEIPLTKEMLSSINLQKAGTYKVNVTYKNKVKKNEFSIKVKEPVKTVTVHLENTNITFGQRIDPKNGYITVSYENKQKDEKILLDAPDADFEVEGYNPFLLGEQTITIICDGVSAETTVKVVAKTLNNRFTLGSDNNSFGHYPYAVYKRDENGNYVFEDYTNDNAGYNSIFDRHTFKNTDSFNGFSDILIDPSGVNSDWHGSCYGIAATMGLLYEGGIEISDLTNRKGISNYYGLAKPREDSKLHDVIECYYLSQNSKDFSKSKVSIAVTNSEDGYVGLSYYKDNGNSITEFLTKLVSVVETNKNRAYLFGYSYFNDKNDDGKYDVGEVSGHAVLIIGGGYTDNTKTKYNVKIYDMNDIQNEREMLIDMDGKGNATSFSYGKITKNDYQFLILVDLDYMSELTDIIRGYSSRVTAAAFMDGIFGSDDEEDPNSHTRLKFSMAEDFTVKNAEGAYITYENGELSGNMYVYTIDVFTDEEAPKYILEVDDSEYFEFYETSSNFDVSITGENGIAELDGKAISYARIEPGKDMQIKGKNFTFDSYISADTSGEVVRISGEAADDIKLIPDGKNVKVLTENGIDNAKVTVYNGFEVVGESEDEHVENIVVNKETGETEINTDVPETSYEGTVITVGANGTYDTLDKALSEIKKLISKKKNDKCYVLQVSENHEEKKAITIPAGSSEFVLTGGPVILNAPTINANASLTVNCDIESKSSGKSAKPLTIKAGKNTTLTIDKLETNTKLILKGAKSDLMLNCDVEADTVAKFNSVNTGEKTLTVTGKITGIQTFNGVLEAGAQTDIVTIGEAKIFIPENAYKKTSITEITKALTVAVNSAGTRINASTPIFTFKGKSFDNSMITVENTSMYGEELTCFLYGKIVKAEYADATTVSLKNGQEIGNYPNLDLAFAAMTDPKGEYVLTINTFFAPFTKFNLPVKIKSLTIHGGTIDLGKTSSISPKCDLYLEGVTLKCANNKYAAIKAGKCNVSLKNSYTGGVTTSGDLTLGYAHIFGDVKAGLLTLENSGYIYGSASVSQLCSTYKYSTGLTVRSLEVTKAGLKKGSTKITLEIIDKNNNAVKFSTEGGKTPVVVKKFVLDKNQKYTAGSIVLSYSCGKGTLKWVNNQLVLVESSESEDDVVIIDD